MAMSERTSSDKKTTKNLIILIIIGAVLMMLIAIIYLMRNNSGTMPSEVTVTGTLTCLPHKNPGEVETLECATGLKTDDNRHYGLIGLPDDSPANEINGRVKISGELSNAAADYNYDVIGIIKVETINEE